MLAEGTDGIHQYLTGIHGFQEALFTCHEICQHYALFNGSIQDIGTCQLSLSSAVEGLCSS